MIKWAKGKTMINLDVKDVPIKTKVEEVKKQHAFDYVMFTVRNAKQEHSFYHYDHHSLFSAWILTKKAMKQYEKAGIPWSNILIAYVGPQITKESKELSDRLHKKGVMVMIGAGPTYDQFSTWMGQRKIAYRKIIKKGYDIIESDRPVEVAKAVKPLYPKKSKKYKYWKRKNRT
jgi:glycerophosphoryl diester phosphodiesterase